MTVADVVANVLAGEHVDFVREAVAILARELMEAEVSLERLTHRNGYRPRGWETRVGEIELAIPRKRSGRGVLPFVPGAAAPFGAGHRRGRAGGVRQRRLDAQGRPAGRAARDSGDE